MRQTNASADSGVHLYAARKQQEKRNGLLEVVAGMEKIALACIEKEEMERARGILAVRSQYLFYRTSALDTHEFRGLRVGRKI